MEENIKWTKSYIESLNERLRAVGMPEFVIDNGFVYKDELHKLLGVGIRLEEEEISQRGLFFLSYIPQRENLNKSYITKVKERIIVICVTTTKNQKYSHQCTEQHMNATIQYTANAHYSKWIRKVWQ